MALTGPSPHSWFVGRFWIILGLGNCPKRFASFCRMHFWMDICRGITIFVVFEGIWKSRTLFDKLLCSCRERLLEIHEFSGHLKSASLVFLIFESRTMIFSDLDLELLTFLDFVWCLAEFPRFGSFCVVIFFGVFLCVRDDFLGFLNLGALGPELLQAQRKRRERKESTS